MFKFLKKLFSTGEGSYTVVILNDDGSKPSSSHRLSPINLWLLCIGILAGTVCLFLALIFFTPLGGYISDQQEVRNSVIAIQQKVANLQDTLNARNIELRQMQKAMVNGEDTNFTAFADTRSDKTPQNEWEQETSTSVQNSDGTLPPLNAREISGLFRKVPEFPASYPLEGTPTRLFNPSSGHFGIDIAAKEGTEFQAVAGGSIINQEWTINYGYVVIVQHSGGIVTIFKHATSTAKNIGESVNQGDVLGTIGDIGILSSGPHMHFELWKNGIPQNPENYIIKP